MTRPPNVVGADFLVDEDDTSVRLLKVLKLELDFRERLDFRCLLDFVVDSVNFDDDDSRDRSDDLLFKSGFDFLLDFFFDLRSFSGCACSIMIRSFIINLKSSQWQSIQ